MKTILIVVVILIIVVGVFFSHKQHRSRTRTDSDPVKSAEVSQELRHLILATDYTKVGIQQFVGTNQVWGVVMEMGYPKATVTLVALADGSASLYFSSGGGFIGGVGHETVRKAAFRMCQVADPFVPACSPAAGFPFPGQGFTSFYILTKNGKVTKTALENELGENKHSLSPLFYAGQDVITQLRLVTKNFK